MELPIPTHLQNHLSPIGDNNTEYEITGNIYCKCNSNEFRVFESNDKEIIQLKCKPCQKEILLFDSGKHGWNGYVCKDDFLNRKMPFRQHYCPKCNNDIFNITVQISSQGKQDFIEECVSNDDTFSSEEWVNGFEWIRVSLTCVNCSEKELWADIETM